MVATEKHVVCATNIGTPRRTTHDNNLHMSEGFAKPRSYVCSTYVLGLSEASDGVLIVGDLVFIFEAPAKLQAFSRPTTSSNPKAILTTPK